MSDIGWPTPLCPKCGLRPQFRMRDGKWRGACHQCWQARNRTHAEGDRRVNARGHAEVVAGGRWVREDRLLAAQAGVTLSPDVQVRRRGDRLEVAVWQAVGGDPVKGLPAGGGDRPAPTGNRPHKKRQGVYVDLDDDWSVMLKWLADEWGISRPAAVRAAIKVMYDSDGLV